MHGSALDAGPCWLPDPKAEERKDSEMSAATLAAIAEAFGVEEPITPGDPYCVGNSHALLEGTYGAHVGRCACGATIRDDGKEPGRWVHYDGRAVCPPYNCACGRRHNA